jgi:hypothetical protein
MLALQSEMLARLIEQKLLLFFDVKEPHASVGCHLGDTRVLGQIVRGRWPGPLPEGDADGLTVD